MKDRCVIALHTLVTLACLTARFPTLAIRFLKSPVLSPPFFLVAASGPLRLPILPCLPARRGWDGLGHEICGLDTTGLDV